LAIKKTSITNIDQQFGENSFQQQNTKKNTGKHAFQFIPFLLNPPRGRAKIQPIFGPEPQLSHNKNHCFRTLHAVHKS